MRGNICEFESQNPVKRFTITFDESPIRMMSFNSDIIISLLVKLSIRFAALMRFKKYTPGEKLKILLIGYNGKQNTGSDTRVVSMIRQFNHILGKDKVQIGVVIFDEKIVDHYFPSPTKQERISSVFFWPLLKTCSRYHMAILSEGGCLKSKFSNSLLLYFIQGTGVMKTQGKPCLAYGVEAGHMDPFVYDMVKYHCDACHFIARTQPSLDIVRTMNLKGHLGTDTAWVFKPAPTTWGYKELKEKLEWDGEQPVIGVSVINPFCWPVKPDIIKFLKRDWLQHPHGHYKKWYFFSDSVKKKELFESYLNAIANSVNKFSEKHNARVAVIGMEALDLFPCQALQKRLSVPSYLFSSKDYDGYKLVSILRSLSLLVTSRYHARVLSMPGKIPSIAISMDERLYNLLAESNHLEDYYLSVDDHDLEGKLTQALDKLFENRKQVSIEIANTVSGYLQKMSGMGAFFRKFIQQNFPDFNLPAPPNDWTGYLPPLDSDLNELVLEYRTPN